MREALHGDAEPGAVHHHEHRREPTVFLADEPAFGGVEVHHAGRIGVDAHLVLDRAAGDAVAAPERAVFVQQNLRREEERNPFHAGRRAFDPRQHEMDDVVGEVVLARRNEYLLARYRVGTVVLPDGARLDEAEVGAAMRLREVHRARPFSRRHFRQVAGLQDCVAMNQQRGRRAVGQGGVHCEGLVRRDRIFAQGDAEEMRQALSSIFRRGRNPHPTALDKGLVGFLEPFGRDHRTVRQAPAALTIPRQVQRLQHFLGEFAALAQHRLDDVDRRLGEARQVAVTLEVEHVAQEEERVAHRRFVNRHRKDPRAKTHRRTVGAALRRYCSYMNYFPAKRNPLESSRIINSDRTYSGNSAGEPLHHGGGTRIGLLPFDAPVAHFVQRDRGAGDGAQDVKSRAYDPKIAVEILNLRFAGRCRAPFEPIHATFFPRGRQGPSGSP